MEDVPVVKRGGRAAKGSAREGNNSKNGQVGPAEFVGNELGELGGGMTREFVDVGRVKAS